MLTVVRGDTWDLVVTYRNPDNTPVDITGYDALLQLRRAAGGEILLQLTSSPAAGLTVDGPTGSVTVHATPAQMDGVRAGRWRAQMQIERSESGTVVDRRTLWTDDVNVTPDGARLTP